MNSFASAALMAQTSGTADKGFFALAIVQGLGVMLAIGLTISIKNAYSCRIPDRWHAWMQNAVWSVLVLTILVGACQKDFAPGVWEAFGGTPPGPFFLYLFDLNASLLIYFLADFAALAFLIYATGGPQQSLYATFLFVIVPITIALGNPGLPIVLAFAAITLFIFLTLLGLKPPKYFTASENGTSPHKTWLAVVTTACVIFPTLVFCIQSWRPNTTMAGSLPQQTGVDTTLTSPADLELLATPGDHGRKSVAGIAQ